MKQNYLCALALSAGFVSFGQNLNSKSFDKDDTQLSLNNNVIPNSQNNPNKAPGDIIWSEDFSGGFPTGWTTVDKTGNNYVWILNNGDIENTSSVPSGYTNATAIASNSGGNHMLLFGDEYNRIQLANTGAATEMDSYFQTSGIQLNGEAGISVEFQQKFRRCCSNSNVEINLVASIDDPTFSGPIGTYDMNGGVGTGTSSGDPMDMSINISDIAGGSNGTLYLRWHIGAGSSHYYWMIDDINVVESPTNDIVTTKGFYGFFGVEYTRIPVSQIQPMSVYMIGENIGTANQTNTALHLNIERGGTNIHTDNSPPLPFPSLDIDTLTIDSTYIPAASPLNTDYTVTIDIHSDSIDQTPANNTHTFSPFQITTAELAIDDHSATPGNGGGNPSPSGANEYEAGNQFDIINQDEDLIFIDLVTGPNTPVGTFIEAVIYQIDFSSSPEAYTEVWRSPGYQITAADLGAVHHFGNELSPGVPSYIPIATLTAGETYFAAVHSYINYEYGISGTNPSAGTPSARHSAIRYPNMSNPTAGESFGLTNTPMIRLILDYGVDIDTVIDETSFSVFPNPSNGEFTISLEGDAKIANIAVKNVVGQTIITKTVNVAGKTIETISLSDYSKGVYFLTVDGETTKLIVE